MSGLYHDVDKSQHIGHITSSSTFHLLSLDDNGSTSYACYNVSDCDTMWHRYTFFVKPQISPLQKLIFP